MRHPYERVSQIFEHFPTGIGVENATFIFPGNEFICNLYSPDEIVCKCNNFADIQCATQVSCSDKVSL
jgi:hypothetical protein